MSGRNTLQRGKIPKRPTPFASRHGPCAPMSSSGAAFVHCCRPSSCCGQGGLGMGLCDIVDRHSMTATCRNDYVKCLQVTFLNPVFISTIIVTTNASYVDHGITNFKLWIPRNVFCALSSTDIESSTDVASMS